MKKNARQIRMNIVYIQREFKKKEKEVAEKTHSDITHSDHTKTADSEKWWTQE